MSSGGDEAFDAVCFEGVEGLDGGLRDAVSVEADEGTVDVEEGCLEHEDRRGFIGRAKLVKKVGKCVGGGRGGVLVTPGGV